MKFSSSILILGWTSIVTGQKNCDASASAIPSCGQSCIISAGSQVGCAMTDYACQCSSSASAAIQSAAFDCVLSSCGPVTGLNVQSAAQAVCSCAAANPPLTSDTLIPTTAASTSASPGSSIGSSSPSATEAPSTTTSTAVQTSSSPVITSSNSAPPASSSSVVPVTGGQGMLQPWAGSSAVALAIFGGLIAFL